MPADIRPSLHWLLFSFRGRIGRWQFWQFIALEALVVLGGNTAVKLFSLPAPDVNMDVALVLLYPQLAVLTKRWHDRGRSAWWLLVLLIPVLGSAWTLLECGFLGGTPAPNRFGTGRNDDWPLIPRRG